MAQAKGFIFYPEHVAVARRLLNDAEIGQLFLAVCDYAETGAIPDFQVNTLVACFDLMRKAIDNNAQKYAETCARNRKNIEKRWKRQASTDEYDGIQSNTTVYGDVPPNTTYTNITEHNITEPNIKSCGVRAKRFTPPTLEEVRAYCAERGNCVDAQRFVDFYTANGWKVGKNSMKDWKAAVRTWERSDSQQKGGKSGVTDPYSGYSTI